MAQQVSVAAERFEIDPHELDLVTQANFVALAVAWNAANPVLDLAPVPAFMGAASITYESLLELLEVVWVRAGGAATTVVGVDDTCDASVQTLAPLDATRLDRMHRFLRLWRHAGWKMWELDLLLQSASVGNNALDAAGFAALFNFRVLQDATHLTVDEQLALFQDIDLGTHREPDGSTASSLYRRLFLAPAIASDPDLMAIQAGVAVTDPILQNHLPAIQAALQISTADANTLFALTNGQLTLANLSLVYRTITLARVASLSLSELLAIAPRTTSGSLVAAFASPAATSAFLGQLKAVQQSGFSVDALVYQLTPPPWATTTGITDADIVSTMTVVRQAILNPTGGNVNGSVAAAVAAQFALANDVTALLVQRLDVPATARTLLSWLTDPALTAQGGGVYTPITRANFPNQFVALELLDKASQLVNRLHLVLADLQWLLAHAGVFGGLGFQQLPVTGAQPALPLGPLLATILLVKLARSFTAAPPQSSIQSLYDLIDGVNAGTLINEASAQAALATITGWPLADVVALTAALGLSFAGGDYKGPAAYDSLRTLETMVMAFGQQRIGPVTTNLASAAQLVSWSMASPDAAAATSAQAVLKSRYSNPAWLAFAPTLTDPIRERHSAALQDWLLAQRDGLGNLVYGDTNALFEHFLIDVQMSACEKTTRVIQAYAAVQIFVERCLLGLEAPGVVVDLSRDDTWNQWSWMKRYRIWEANRQVFLYPENWLIESQRPSRTELFKKLEQEVRQNDSTADYLETVALN
ncbi:MAG: hypothetical protein M3069_20615, partial [Chloroflexota bacterium]|nr:hypothetical protein [Chloroflexota bacterium]